MAKSASDRIFTKQEPGQVISNDPKKIIKDRMINPSYQEPVMEEDMEGGIEDGVMSNLDASKADPREAKEALTQNKIKEAQARKEVEARIEAEKAKVDDSGILVDKDGAKKLMLGKQKVLIKIATDIPKTKIGGTWYSFAKGRTYKVPRNVKRVLLKRPGLLLPTY